MNRYLIFYNYIGFLTLFTREIHRFMKVSVQAIIAPLLSNILYLGIFGGILKTRAVGIEGINYILFIVPGLAIMGAIFAAFQNPAFSIISQKFQNTIQDLNSYPISNIEKSLAFILGGTFRGTLIGALTYLATVFFVGFDIKYPLLFFVMLGVTSFIFSSIGLIFGLILNNYEKLNFILSLIITPLIYLGGVFFEISKLPGFLPGVKYINPIFPLVNMTRFAYLGVYEGDILPQTLTIAAFALGSFLLAIYTFKKGIGIKTR